MSRISLTLSSVVPQSARVAQIASLFDLHETAISAETIDVDVDIDSRPWTIGAIVGPSGSGKSALARHLWGDAVVLACSDWPRDKPIVEAFPDRLSMHDIAQLLTRVGLGSVPSWLRPYHVLSLGERFRADLARLVAEAIVEQRTIIVMDEYSSMIDRDVARVASYALAKLLRKHSVKFVAVSSHNDFLEWLGPDWYIDMRTRKTEWRDFERPFLRLLIREARRDEWERFRRYHYLSHRENGTMRFVAYREDTGDVVAYNAVRNLVHQRKDVILGHRLVVLPEYQGLGIGCKFDDWLGEYLYRRGYIYRNVVVHPTMIAYYSRSPRWRLKHINLRTTNTTSTNVNCYNNSRYSGRRTYTFEYVPGLLDDTIIHL